MNKKTIDLKVLILYTVPYNFFFFLFIFFFKEVSSAHQGCIYLIRNTEKL